MRYSILLAAGVVGSSLILNSAANGAQRPNLGISDIATPGGICKKKRIRVSIVNSSQTVGTNDKIPVKITVETPNKKFSRVEYRNGIGPNTKSGQPVWFNNLPIDTTVDKIKITAHVNHKKAVTESNYNDNKEVHTANCVPDNNQNGGNEHAANHGNKCDLQATISGSQSTLPGTYPAKLNVKFKNIGKKKCPDTKIAMYRYKGNSTNGTSQTIGQLNLKALDPNKQATLKFVDEKHAKNGTYTYAMKFVGKHSDGNNKNHSPKKTVTFKTANGGNNNGGGNKPCDLHAQLEYKQLSSNSREWKAKFKNIGGEKCPGNNISLSRYDGKTASGYGVRIGGSGAIEKLNPLDPNKSRTLKWTENRAPKGTYTYKIKYSGPQNDTDNKNHHPQNTINAQ